MQATRPPTRDASAERPRDRSSRGRPGVTFLLLRSRGSCRSRDRAGPAGQTRQRCSPYASRRQPSKITTAACPCWPAVSPGPLLGGLAAPLQGRELSRGQAGVGQIVFAPPAFLPARTLALLRGDARLLEEPHEPCPGSCPCPRPRTLVRRAPAPSKARNGNQTKTSLSRSYRVGRRACRARQRRERPCGCRRRSRPSTASPSLLLIEALDRPGQGCVGQMNRPGFMQAVWLECQLPGLRGDERSRWLRIRRVG